MPPPEPEPIQLDENISASWAKVFGYSEQELKRYSRYYTFTLDHPKYVKITASSTIPNYLYLLDSDKETIVSNKSYVYYSYGYSGSSSSVLYKYLEASTYTIEVLSHNVGQEGEFNLSLSKAKYPTLTDINLNTEVRGQWSEDSGISPNRYTHSNHFTFTLSQRTSIRINLSTDIPAAIYLEDDNHTLLVPEEYASSGHDAEIYTTLNAGTYVIDAAVSPSFPVGSFSISVNEDFLRPPSPVASLKATSIKPHEVKIHWTHGTHDAVGYKVYINNKLQETIISNGIPDFSYSYTVDGLLPDKVYTYRIVAFTGAGNTSSEKKSFRTKKDDFAWLVPIITLLL